MEVAEWQGEARMAMQAWSYGQGWHHQTGKAMNDDVFTIDDLISRWKTSESTVKRTIANPKFPRPFIVGKKGRRYRRVDVENWEAKR